MSPLTRAHLLADANLARADRAFVDNPTPERERAMFAAADAAGVARARWIKAGCPDTEPEPLPGPLFFVRFDPALCDPWTLAPDPEDLAWSGDLGRGR